MIESWGFATIGLSVLALALLFWRSPKVRTRLRSNREQYGLHWEQTKKMALLSVRLQRELDTGIAINESDDSEATRKAAEQFVEVNAAPIAQELKSALMQRFGVAFGHAIETLVQAIDSLNGVLDQDHAAIDRETFEEEFVVTLDAVERAMKEFDAQLCRGAHGFDEYRAAYVYAIFATKLALDLGIAGEFDAPYVTYEFDSLGYTYVMKPLGARAHADRITWLRNHYDDNPSSQALADA